MKHSYWELNERTKTLSYIEVGSGPNCLETYRVFTFPQGRYLDTGWKEIDVSGDYRTPSQDDQATFYLVRQRLERALIFLKAKAGKLNDAPYTAQLTAFKQPFSGASDGSWFYLSTDQGRLTNAMETGEI